MEDNSPTVEPTPSADHQVSGGQPRPDGFKTIAGADYTIGQELDPHKKMSEEMMRIYGDIATYENYLKELEEAGQTETDEYKQTQKHLGDAREELNANFPGLSEH